jgi:hypothetical protein
MKSSRSFLNRKGISIFETYKTREEIEKHIIYNIEVLPNMSLFLNTSHPLEQIWDDLKEYTTLYSDEIIDRKAALCDLFKILAKAQSDDNPEKIEEYETFLIQELLVLWTGNYFENIDDSLISEHRFRITEEHLKMIEKLGYKYDGKLSFKRQR